MYDSGGSIFFRGPIYILSIIYFSSAPREKASRYMWFWSHVRWNALIWNRKRWFFWSVIVQGVVKIKLESVLLHSFTSCFDTVRLWRHRCKDVGGSALYCATHNLSTLCTFKSTLRLKCAAPHCYAIIKETLVVLTLPDWLHRRKIGGTSEHIPFLLSQIIRQASLLSRVLYALCSVPYCNARIKRFISYLPPRCGVGGGRGRLIK